MAEYKDVTTARENVGRCLEGLTKKNQLAVLEQLIVRVRNLGDRRVLKLERRFKTQLAKLRRRGVPAYLVKMLEGQEGRVLDTARENGLATHPIPFLPVIPFRYIGVHGQVKMVEKDVQGIRYDFDPTKLADAWEMPHVPYFIYGVESNERGTPLEARQLSLAEALAVAIHGAKLDPFFADATTWDGKLTPIVIADPAEPGVIVLEKRAGGQVASLWRRPFMF